MITRFVKLHIKPKEVHLFVKLFKDTSHLIRAFEGCEKVELLQEISNPAVFFTNSIWQSEDHLNAYRHSKTFLGIWSEAKKLFDEKPQAWTLNVAGA